MKKILVPIDFSEAAQNAFVFAERIAAHFGAEMEIVHIYDGLFDNNAFIPNSLKSREQNLLKRMRNFVQLTPAEGGVGTNVPIKYTVELAYNKTDKIAALSKNYDLVVVGMVSKHKIEKKWFGSFASSVAQNAKCPVLLIPRTAKYKGFHNMLYASNWESINKATLQQMAKWANRFDTSIDFVHVIQNKLSDFNITHYPSLWKVFEEYAPEISYTSVNIQSTSPIKGVYEYIKANEVDLLVLVNRQRKWYENIFGENMTKELSLRAHIPILVYQRIDQKPLYK